MKTKYTAEKNDKANKLILTEYTQTDEETFSLSNQAVYERKAIEAAVLKDRKT